jgi:hypothetical protein
MNEEVIDKEFKESHQIVVSNHYWDYTFAMLEFMMNDVYPSDFKEFSPDGVIKDYFKNKFKITARQ